jgi:asparagine synthase (glutamine-hydrolysing)
MCGISAVVEYGAGASSASAVLWRAHEALAHRGPDGEGFLWIGRDGRPHRSDAWPPRIETPIANRSADPVLALAFRQLKVQDLSADAIQPLGSSDSLYWIAFNGEIYNAGELRSALRSRGHCFRTCADTEVALAAYREWGTDCFTRFNGMWAMLVVDVVQRTLVGSRDRLGIKPLYYWVEPDRLILASEPQAIVRALDERPALHANRLREFLLGLPPQTSGDTFFKGIRLVPPASVFRIDLRAARAAAPSFQRFWDLHDFVACAGRAETIERASAELRSRVESAVDTHADAAVPVGCLLSGGLDSSFVARAMAVRAQARGDAPVPAYSIVYDDSEMTELPFVWSVVRQGGLESHTRQLTPLEAWRDVDRVVRVQGQPLLGQELIAQYHAYQFARAHGSVVILEGQGADELLAGLPSYAAVIFDELLARRRFGRLAGELWAESRARHRSPVRRLARVMRWAARAVAGPVVRTLPGWVDGNALSADHPADAGWTPSRDTSLLNQHLFRLVTRTNLQTVMPLQDRSSMAHGVESRVPFLDHRVVEYCFTLPASFKVGDGERKRVLKEAARGLVPNAVVQRRDKKTFVSKMDWIPLRVQHASELREMAARMQGAYWVRPRKLIAFVEDYLEGRHDDLPAVWRLYTAWRWLELFQVRSS